MELAVTIKLPKNKEKVFVLDGKKKDINDENIDYFLMLIDEFIEDNEPKPKKELILCMISVVDDKDNDINMSFTTSDYNYLMTIIESVVVISTIEI